MEKFSNGFFKLDRTPEEAYFGLIAKYSENEIIRITELYMQDVIKFLFGELPNDTSVIVPSEKQAKIDKFYSSSILKYSWSEKYINLETEENELKSEFIKLIKDIFNHDFPLRHFKLGFLSHSNSINRFTITENSTAFFKLLPFPSYIYWAFRNPEKSKLYLSEATILNWESKVIKRIKRIEIIQINESKLSFKPQLESKYINELEFLL